MLTEERKPHGFLQEREKKLRLDGQTRQTDLYDVYCCVQQTALLHRPKNKWSRPCQRRHSWHMWDLMRKAARSMVWVTLLARQEMSPPRDAGNNVKELLYFLSNLFTYQCPICNIFHHQFSLAKHFHASHTNSWQTYFTHSVRYYRAQILTGCFKRVNGIKGYLRTSLFIINWAPLHSFSLQKYFTYQICNRFLMPMLSH